MDFQDRTVWITGASSGIGEALAEAFAAEGAKVIASGRRRDALERLAERLPTDHLLLPFDTTDESALPGVVGEAESFTGGIDVLVNNAGISQRSLALDTDFSVYRRIMEVDFFAPVRLTQLVLPGMVERRSGHVAVVSSVAGRLGTPLRTGYSAAKFAVCGYFEALRAEVEKAYGIGVSVILPGSVRTDVARNALTGSGDPRGSSDVNIDCGMAPREAAAIILQGMKEGRREIPVAEGMEAAALQMRSANPEALFDMLAEQGRTLAEAREKGAPVDPERHGD